MEGKKVSPFSATQIGAVENAGLRNIIRTQFKEESKVILEHTKGLHHTRRQGHMQSFYPDTVSTLESYKRTSAPAPIPAPPQPRHGANYNIITMKQQEFVSNLNTTAAKESNFNQNRKLFNRDVGQQATVSKVSGHSLQDKFFVECDSILQMK